MTILLPPDIKGLNKLIESNLIELGFNTDISTWFSRIFRISQKRIYNPLEHLRWRFLWKKLT